MKKAILNVVTYSMIGWGAISAVYLGLPIEVKEMLPDMNWVTALVSGGTTTILGSAILVFKATMNKAKIANNEVYASVATLILDHKAEYKEIVKSNLEVAKSNMEVKAVTERNNLLLETLLETKLSNPLIDEITKNIINGVLGKEGVVDEVEQDI